MTTGNWKLVLQAIAAVLYLAREIWDVVTGWKK